MNWDFVDVISIYCKRAFCLLPSFQSGNKYRCLGSREHSNLHLLGQIFSPHSSFPIFYLPSKRLQSRKLLILTIMPQKPVQGVFFYDTF